MSKKSSSSGYNSAYMVDVILAKQLALKACTKNPIFSDNITVTKDLFFTEGTSHTIKIINNGTPTPADILYFEAYKFVFTGDLCITGTVTLGTLEVNGDFSVGTNDIERFFVHGSTGNTLIGGTLEVQGGTTLKENVIVADGKTLTVGNETASGCSILGSGYITTTGHIKGESLEVTTGATSLGGTLEVDGVTTLKNSVGVAGANTLTVGTGATALGGTLEVQGGTTLKDDVSVVDGKTLTVGTGATALGGTLGVTGVTTLTGALDAKSTANIADTLTLSKTSGNGLIVAAGTNIQGFLEVHNSTTLNDANITSITESTTKDSGALTVAGGVGIVKNVKIGGTLGVAGTLYVGDNFNMSENGTDTIITVGNPLKVTNGNNDIISASTTNIELTTTLSGGGGTTITGDFARLVTDNSSYPDNGNDLIRKQDLTNLANGFKVKGSVALSTDENTFTDLTITGLTTGSGVNGTLTFSTTTNLFAQITQPTGVGSDTANVTLVEGDLILIRDIEDSSGITNTSGSDSNLCNGVYTIPASATSGAGTSGDPYVYNLIRTDNMANGLNAYSATVYVDGGGYEYQIYIQTAGNLNSDIPAVEVDTIGVDPIVFTKFSSNRPSVSGPGIDVSNHVISVNLDTATTNQLYFTTDANPKLAFDQTKITGVATTGLTAGSIATGFGAISTENAITTTGTITGGSLAGSLTTASQQAITEVGALSVGSIATGFGNITTGGVISTTNTTSSASSASTGALTVAGGIGCGEIYATTYHNLPAMVEVDANGDVNIAGHLTVDGTITAGATTTSSDLRLKENITPIQNALEKTLQMQGVEYNLIKDLEKKNQIGVIAQDIEKIIPEVVYTDEKGMKSVAYQNLTAVLIEAVKELSNKVNELELKLQNA